MAHQFVVNATIKGVSLDDFRRLAANISLHENVCRRIPGEKLEILESNKVGDIYTLKRAYNLDVNIPDIAKKFLKDAFRFPTMSPMPLQEASHCLWFNGSVSIATLARCIIFGWSVWFASSQLWFIELGSRRSTKMTKPFNRRVSFYASYFENMRSKPLA